MAEALATKYRPKTFDTTLSQKSTISILKRQLEMNQISNVYLFCGPSGTGKTTLARIFANEVNHGIGSPIEIDGASNNGVDNVRQIIEDANQRSIEGTYKIYIIDEVHMMTTSAFNALLKTLEEPPVYTIFMLCTTDPQKIPATILNRVMRFNLTKIPSEDIKNRLLYICQQEGFINYEESCDYISKLAAGCAREAISYLDKCSKYSTDLSITNVLQCLGNISYQTMFKFTNALVDRDDATVISILEDFYNSGNDLKLFVDNYLDFVLDLDKYCILNNINCTKIPTSLELVDKSPLCVKYVVGFEGSKDYFKKLISKVLEIKNLIKNDTTIKTTTEISFLALCRGF